MLWHRVFRNTGPADVLYTSLRRPGRPGWCCRLLRVVGGRRELAMGLVAAVVVVVAVVVVAKLLGHGPVGPVCVRINKYIDYTHPRPAVFAPHFIRVRAHQLAIITLFPRHVILTTYPEHVLASQGPKIRACLLPNALLVSHLIWQ